MKRNFRRNPVLLLLLLVLTSVSLMIIDHRSGARSPLDGLRHAGAAVFGPAVQLAGSVTNTAADAFSRLRGERLEARAASELTRENAELRRRLRTSELARNRATQLDELLGVAAAGQYRTVPAEVIAVAPAQRLRRTVTIDAGSRDGIKRDMTVINGKGLVGRVRTVGPWTATVLLAIDADSAVGVRMEDSMEIGIASGRGGGERPGMSLQLLDSQAPLARGDRVVTFGSRGNRPYVAGVPVGVVKEVQQTPGTLTRVATVEPYVDFTALELVGVVVEPPRRNPRDSVLPPRPDADQPAAVSSAAATAGR